MGDPFNKVVKDFAKSLQAIAPDRTSPYDTQAEVRRIEGNTAWVHIPGGVDETPVQLTTNAKKGDIVQVRVSGGQAWITGNATSPPTDDTTAKAAQETAATADEHAVEAVTSAMLAQQFAETAREEASSASYAANQAWTKAGEAEIAATTAEDSADRAQKSANEAKDSADNALDNSRLSNVYARNALSMLADIEDVVDALGWISEHGTYSATSDIQIDPNKAYYRLTSTNNFERVPVPISTCIKDMYERTETVYYKKTRDSFVDSQKTYYVYDSTNDEYIVVTNPVDSDIPLYFERFVDVGYVLTSDTSPVSGKTYYAYDQTTGVYIEETPTATIGPYYELSLDESVRNYLLTHISMTDSGLEVMRDGNSYRMLIASNEIRIINDLGATVASYSDEIILGEEANGIRNVITSTRMSFSTNSGDVAYFGLNNQGIWEMHIDTSYIDDMMRFGDYAWIKRNNGNMTLKWLGV